MTSTGTVHRLKTWPAYLEEVISGRKTFEVRVNDRDYRVGDRLHLLGFDPDTGEYNGREHTLNVTYVLHGGTFGIDRDHVVMGLKPFRFDDEPRRPTATDARLQELLADARKGCATLVAERVRILAALGLLDDREQWSEADVLARIKELRRESPPEPPYCDVCGREGKGLFSAVEVCRDCYDSVEYNTCAWIEKVVRLLGHLVPGSEDKNAENLLEQRRLLLACMPRRAPADCASPGEKEKIDVGMGERASGGVHDPGAAVDRGVQSGEPAVPVRVPTEPRLSAVDELTSEAEKLGMYPTADSSGAGLGDVAKAGFDLIMMTPGLTAKALDAYTDIVRAEERDRHQRLRHDVVAIGVKAQEDGNETIRGMVAQALWGDPVTANPRVKP